MSHAMQLTESHKNGASTRPLSGGRLGNAGRAGKIFSREMQIAFLKKYRVYKNVDRAAKSIGFRGTTVFRQLHASKRFAAEYEEVRMTFMGELEEKLRGFAFGTERPIHNSQITAIFGCLRAFKPERWRENMSVKIGAEGDFATLIRGMSLALNQANEQKSNGAALEHPKE